LDLIEGLDILVKGKRRREDICVIPGPVTDLDAMLDSKIDGPNTERRKFESARISQSNTHVG
jgi:hypothetical protein